MIEGSNKLEIDLRGLKNEEALLFGRNFIPQ